MFLGGCPCCGKRGGPCNGNACQARFRLAGNPLARRIEEGTSFVVNNPYPDLAITGDINRTFFVKDFEEGRTNFLTIQSNEESTSLTTIYPRFAYPGLGQTADCAYANIATFGVHPFQDLFDAGAIKNNYYLETYWPNQPFQNNQESAIVGAFLGATGPLYEPLEFAFIRSMSLGPVVLSQSNDPWAINQLFLFAENGQVALPFESAAVPPEEWSSPLGFVAEVWQASGERKNNGTLTLLASRSFQLSWPDVFNVYNDCPLTPSVPGFTKRCYYTNYEFLCVDYYGPESAPEGAVLDFLAPNSYGPRSDCLPGLSGLGEPYRVCGYCCGEHKEYYEEFNPPTGHTLYNSIEASPVGLNDAFPGSISGSMVNGLTPLRCISVSSDQILFADDPVDTVICKPAQWLIFPNTTVDGFQCIVLDPYCPNDRDIETPDGTPIPNLGEYESCEECARNSPLPQLPEGCQRTSNLSPRYTASIALDSTCRASSVTLSFPDIMTLTAGNSGYPDYLPTNQPGGWHPVSLLTMLTVRINKAGVRMDVPITNSSMPQLSLAVNFGGQTLGSKTTQTAIFSHRPDVDENPQPHIQQKYVSQDNFSGPLNITVVGPSESWDVSINIGGAYDSYCWLGGYDGDGNRNTPKPSNPSPYDAGLFEPVTPPMPNTRTLDMPTTTTIGPGTHLKNMLALIGIREKEKGCKCGHWQKKMDGGGPQWCRDHKDEILDHLAKEAKKRGLPFVKLAASQLLDLAIRRSERG